MNIVISKILSALLIGLSGLLGCLIPYLVRRFSRNRNDAGKRQGEIDSRLCLCNCFGAGIVMAMAFYHILPEAVEQCEHSGLSWKINEGSFNPAHFMVLMSFMIMLFLERVLSAGRTPCTAAFNDCQEDNQCCGVEKEDRHCCEDGKRRSSCEELQRQEIDTEMAPDDIRHCSLGSRFRHRHVTFISKLIKFLCPLCECNGLCITLALFVHSLFEGVVVGLIDSHWNIWLITIGIILHKWAAGMAMSSFVSNNKKAYAIALQAIFCFGSPLGILVGGITSGGAPRVEAIMNCIAVGSLIYIGMEIITHELFCHIHCHKTALLKWLCVVTGTMFIFMTSLLEVYMSGGCGHSHGLGDLSDNHHHSH
ncbi:ZIP zinc transporter like protein [Babesia gibsoni]|uniref:ZIP zinc transporter like protein n=1 Tax=Babesia gibsoni TaxID=33632 RepID=A0AAD8PF43_BABGI|nr:ZIP zinc transporter like protein [Babesia gibsoni]